MRIVLAALVLIPFTALAADDTDHVRVSLISEQTALVPGTTAWLGVRLSHDPHWHTYWINPGDSGLPTKLSWTLPEGYRASDIAWPAPHRIAVGELTNFGYTGDIILPVQVTVPESAQDGGTAHIAVDAKWLVCQEECIPGKGSFALDMPVRSITANDTNVERLFSVARESCAAGSAVVRRCARRRRQCRSHAAYHDACRTPRRSTRSRSIAKSSPTRRRRLRIIRKTSRSRSRKANISPARRRDSLYSWSRADRRGMSLFHSMRPTHLRRNKGNRP